MCSDSYTLRLSNVAQTDNGDLVRAYNSNLFYLNDENELVSGKNEINRLSKLTENSLYKFLNNNFHSIRFIKIMYVNFFVNYNDKDKLTMDSEEANNKLAKDYTLPKKLYLRIAEEVKKCKSNLILINLAWRNIEIDKNLIFYKENKNFFVNNDISYILFNNLIRNYTVAINSQSSSSQIFFHIESCSINFSRSFSIGMCSK